MTSRGPSGPTSADEFTERLRQLVAANVAGSTQLLTRFTTFVRDATEAVRAGQVGERNDAQALLSRWLDFNLASYSVLSTQSLALLNGLLSAAESTLTQNSPPAPSAAAPVQRVELRLSGRHGERITAGFVIENHFDRPLSVTFQSTDLVPMAGASIPASFVSFEPTTLVLAPRGQGVVQVSVVITADFVVAQTYTATIRLLGFEPKEMGLSVTILPPAEVAVPSHSDFKPPKSAKKRRSRARG